MGCCHHYYFQVIPMKFLQISWILKSCVSNSQKYKHLYQNFHVLWSYPSIENRQIKSIWPTGNLSKNKRKCFQLPEKYSYFESLHLKGRGMDYQPYCYYCFFSSCFPLTQQMISLFQWMSDGRQYESKTMKNKTKEPQNLWKKLQMP